MPRDGSLILSDVRLPTLTIVCETSGRRGRYRVERLIVQHGDAKLTDLLQTLADFSKARCHRLIGQGFSVIRLYASPGRS